MQHRIKGDGNFYRLMSNSGRAYTCDDDDSPNRIKIVLKWRGYKNGWRGEQFIITQHLRRVNLPEFICFSILRKFSISLSPLRMYPWKNSLEFFKNGSMSASGCWRMKSYSRFKPSLVLSLLPIFWKISVSIVWLARDRELRCDWSGTSWACAIFKLFKKIIRFQICVTFWCC